MHAIQGFNNSVHFNVRKVVMWSLALLCLYILLAHPAMAQVGGGTGTVTAVNTRVTNVVTSFQAVIFGIGGFILSAAFMYIGYGMAFGGKKWSDVANVAYGAIISGAGAMLVGWLFA